MKLKLVSLLLLACILATFTSCNKYGIEEPNPELVFPSSVEREITLNVGEMVVNSYIMYKGLVDFSANDIIFVSSNPEVVSVEISSQEFPIYTYFDIKAISVGESIIHAEARDGTIFSELIKVTVIEATANETSTEAMESIPTLESELETTETSLSEPTTENELSDTITLETHFETDAAESKTPEVESVTETKTEKVTEKSELSVSETYVLNTSSKKFHYPTCSFVKRMKDENKQNYTGSRDSLIAKGYSACKTCKC